MTGQNIATTAGAFDTTFNGYSDAWVTKLDAGPPDTLISSGPSGSTNVTAQSFSYLATETPATFECRLDTPAGAGAYGELRTVLRHHGRRHLHILVRAIDAAGNADATPATRSFTVDTIAPDTSVTGGASGATNQTNQSFAFAATENASYECRLDTPAGTGGYSACTSPQAYTTTANGAYTFSVRATDAAGNADASPATRGFRSTPSRPTRP